MMASWQVWCLVAIPCFVLASEKTFEEVKNCRPPSINEEKELFYFISQKSIIVPCTATGTPNIKYNWLKDGKPVNVENGGDRWSLIPGVGSLRINNPVDSDSGIYQCQATNECGRSLSNFITLLHAKMDPFPPVDVAKVLTQQKGHNLKLVCKPPNSVPKATVRWILANPSNEVVYNDENADTAFNYVPLSQRVTMDYEGNLHITSVREDDEQNGKLYVCVAENGPTRSIVKGEDKQVKAMGREVSEMAVNIIWTSDNNTLVLEGGKARFKCIFSGEPLPQISWTKVTGHLDKNRVSIENHEMIINDVKFVDAGEYECMGKNKLFPEPVRRKFTLRVQAAPKWVSNPEDLVVGVDETTSVNCDVTGDPAPTVKWFINGRSYEGLPPNPKRSLKDNIMTFSELDKDDSQVIQCNASNIHGYIWSDIYLYVEAQAPVIERPPVDKIAAEHQTVTVTCHVSGKPKPKVIWYKGGQLLEGSHFTILDAGDLVIQNTSTKNSGRYKCIAENKFGLVEAEADVIIREKTKIVNAPMDTEVDFPNTVAFTCGATTDPKETVSFRWLKDGVEIKADEHIKISDGTLEINSTKSKDSGIYTCVAYNSLDNATAQAELKVKAVPDPPYNVTLEDCDANKAKVRWTFDEKMRNFVNMIKFIVEYTTEYKPGVWKTATSIPHPALDADIHLSPYVKYKFRVKAVNAMGISEPSLPTGGWCSTPLGVPDKNPDGVTTDEQETGFLVVKWNAMDEMDHNGPEFRYQVEVQGPDDEQFVVHEVKDSKATEIKIPVNDVYKPYQIRVKAVNQVGISMAIPETITGFSGEAAPLVVPENFELDPDVNVTATSAGFRWDPVDTSPNVIRGKFSGYKIQFWKSGQKETTLHAHIIHAEPASGRRRRDGKVRGVVANLPSFSQIEAEVVVINKNFQSNGSNMVNFTTPEGVPGPVSFLVALVRGSHHFLLQWGRPTEENGQITGYQLSYTKIDRLDMSDRLVAFENIGPEVERLTLKGLSPHSQYRIYLQAKTAMGLGKEYFIDVWTTSNTTRLVMPVVVDASPGENEANITWQVTAEKGSRHGKYYYMEYKKKTAKDWVRHKEPVEGDYWGMLKHLEPGTQYMVRIVAASTATDDGDYLASDPFHFVTAGVGFMAMALTLSANVTANKTHREEPTLAGAAKANFLTAAWFIGMMVAIAILILILIIVCIIKRNRGDNYPVQEKERLRGTYNDDNPDHFNGFGKGDDNGLQGSNSFDRDAEKVPLDEDTDSLDYGDDDASKFNEDGSFIGQYGRGEKGNEGTNASSIV
ncbi:neuroglian-like isoform X2 [Biomphalaria pfeifferi]|uniref:Neuroglian-like isoform X2 n=1 Tax=Biomphalaria pfeifferi TaxID=112525 RepID=A0AAD8B0Z2_BIOPF|nr:neuroglian-like isoform X2 [Biomphalaria pfeifferi]